MTSFDLQRQLEEKTIALEDAIRKYVSPTQPRMIFIDLLNPFVEDFTSMVNLIEKIPLLSPIIPSYKQRIKSTGLEVIY